VRLFLLWLTLAAPAAAADLDSDGYESFAAGGDDCVDTDAEIHPGATEVVDGIDNDCDGRVDEGTDYSDDDGDGYSEVGGDCDDTRADVHPGARETWDAPRTTTAMG
jgi:hypothetical protein